MPKLRFIRIWAPGPVVGIENIPLIPQLRELIIGSDSFTQEHLPLIAASPLLNNLVIIQIPFDDLDALNDSPRIKSLSLVGVTTLAPEAIARLTKITTLRISKPGFTDESGCVTALKWHHRDAGARSSRLGCVDQVGLDPDQGSGEADRGTVVAGGLV